MCYVYGFIYSMYMHNYRMVYTHENTNKQMKPIKNVHERFVAWANLLNVYVKFAVNVRLYGRVTIGHSDDAGYVLEVVMIFYFHLQQTRSACAPYCIMMCTFIYSHILTSIYAHHLKLYHSTPHLTIYNHNITTPLHSQARTHAHARTHTCAHTHTHISLRENYFWSIHVF